MEGIQHRVDCPGKGRRISSHIMPGSIDHETNTMVESTRCLDCNRGAIKRIPLHDHEVESDEH